MEFKELIEARRSVRKYAPGEISRDEISAIVGEALNAPSWKNTEDEVVTSVIALGKSAQSAAKPPRKPVGEVLKIG